LSCIFHAGVPFYEKEGKGEQIETSTKSPNGKFLRVTLHKNKGGTG